MKKSIVTVIGIGIFCLNVLALAEPVRMKNAPNSDSRMEALVKMPSSGAAYTQKQKTEQEEGGGLLWNFVLAPVSDFNKNRFCVSVDNNVEIAAPPEGLDFFMVYYYRTREKGSIWGEWRKYYTGSIWHWSQEDSWNYYLRLHWYMSEELETIPPSQGQFRVEMYDAAGGVLLETATTKDRWYWYPILIESQAYDNIGLP